MDGSHAFLLDDPTYQYTGEKQCRDRVWCHVWISEKATTNSTTFEHREWYWAFRINDEPLQQWIPMKFFVTLYNSLGAVLISSESSKLHLLMSWTVTEALGFFNFRRDPSTIFEIDETMADCYRAMGPAGK